jgi:prepilin-type processing-associated H-X9-DG protein
MEQQPLYDIFAPHLQEGGAGFYSLESVPNWNTIPPPPYARCPSDQVDWPAASYAASMGPQCNSSCHEPFASLGNPALYGSNCCNSRGDNADADCLRGLFGIDSTKITLSSISDGLSNTIMIGEILPSHNDHATYPNGYALSNSWMSPNGGAGRAGTLPPINYATPDPEDCATKPNTSRQNWHLSFGFRSNHAGGANFLFGDGSVRFLRQDIDHTNTYQYLGCRHDGQPVAIP